MTTLEIKPRWADKTARFKGTVAAGEVVAVTVNGAADWINSNALRLRIVNERGDTVAQFPVPDEVYDAETMPANTWGTDGDENEDATCQLSLNTDQMRRCVPHGTRMLLFVLDDPTQGNGILYFKDLCEVTHWPDRTGEDSPAPIDLGNYRNFLREAQDAMEDAADRVEAAETQIAASANDATAAATAAAASQSAAEAAQLAIPAQVESAIDSADIPGVVASEVEEQLEYKQDSLTDEQMAAVDSGITEEILGAIQGDIDDLQSGKADVSTVNASLALKANAADMETALANKAGNSALSAEVAARASADSTLNAKVATLIGTDDNMSARDIAQQEVAKIVASADADFDTLKEVADWIKSDTTGAAKMQADISDLKDRNEFTDAEKAKLAGVEAGANNYTLPAAGASTLGGVKVGANLSIDANGVLSVTGGTSVAVDDELSTESENPVQNKAVAAALNGKRGKLDLNVYEDAVGWMLEYEGTVYGTLTPFYNEQTSQSGWLLVHDDVSGDMWGLSFQDGRWTLASTNLPGGVYVTAPADAAELTFDVGDGTSLILTRVSPISTGTLARTSDLPTWNALKPVGGIPATDLASGVQTSLGKADTALQSGDIIAPSDATESGKAADALAVKTALALKADASSLPYALVDVTVTNGTAQLTDRAINAVSLTASATLAFPAQTAGKARDFVVRLTLTETDNVVPSVTFPADVAYETEGGEWPDLTEAGTSIVRLTEVPTASESETARFFLQCSSAVADATPPSAGGAA